MNRRSRSPGLSTTARSTTVPSGRSSGSSSKAGMASMVRAEPEARIKIAYEEYVCEVALRKTRQSRRQVALREVVPPGIVGPQRLQARRGQGPRRVRLAQARERTTSPRALRSPHDPATRPRCGLSRGLSFRRPARVEHSPGVRGAQVLMIEPRGRSTPGDGRREDEPEGSSERLDLLPYGGAEVSGARHDVRPRACDLRRSSQHHGGRRSAGARSLRPLARAADDDGSLPRARGQPDLVPKITATVAAA